MTAVASPSAPRSVRYRTSYVDMYRALRAINQFTPLSRRMRQASLAMFGLGVALLVAAYVSQSNSSALLSVAFFLLIFPLIFFPLTLLLPAYMAWLTRHRSAMWSGEQELTFDDGGIHSRGGAFNGFMRWDAIVRVEESRRFILFFTSAQCACFLPKGALPNAESAGELSAFVRARVGKRGTVDGVAERRSTFDGPPRVTSTFDIDVSELTRASMATMRRRRMLLLWPWYLLVIVVVGWTTIPTMHRQWSDGGWDAVNVTTPIVQLVPFALLVAALPLVTRWTARRQKRTSPSAAGPQTTHVYNEGIEVSGALYNGEFPWAMLQRAEETEEFFLFSLSTVQVMYLPKRTLPQQELEMLREIIRSGMGPRAKLLERDSPAT